MNDMYWRNARKELPVDQEEVLVCTRSKNGVRSIDKGYWSINRWVHRGCAEVTHWMPLPAFTAHDFDDNDKRSYSVTTTDELRRLCIVNQWFTEGSNEQYDKLFYANEQGWPIEEIATIIWLCTDCEVVNKYGRQWCRRDILFELREAKKRYDNLLIREELADEQG